ncbi:unnamed protein product [Darwinula stevensoni]|uniref:Uncharacterized protein n=1 Tax=Darwinula stevensoni TaxID=69355 RepID=A0A7R8X6U0_9CRUS|nr:unnamed protein product [Darwinula stevensoni]CAG0879800.1 unnamed protein product [Darwinula stevensoni]
MWRLTCHPRGYSLVDVMAFPVLTLMRGSAGLSLAIRRSTRSLSMFLQWDERDWGRIILNAEKVVGYPTSYLSLRSLLSDEAANIALHLKKLLGSHHPLISTAKALMTGEREMSQLRGLMILLLSKTAGGSQPLSIQQRSLAEVVETIHLAQLIHMGIQDQQDDIPSGDDALGNRMATLSGDYFLAQASHSLALLNSTKVVELMSGAIRDFSLSWFVKQPESQEEWEEKAYLRRGSLLANGFQAALTLANASTYLQAQAFVLGSRLAAAWQGESSFKVDYSLVQLRIAEVKDILWRDFPDSDARLAFWNVMLGLTGLETKNISI